jgi:hypothetical protein
MAIMLIKYKENRNIRNKSFKTNYGEICYEYGKRAIARQDS